MHVSSILSIIISSPPSTVACSIWFDDSAHYTCETVPPCCNGYRALGKGQDAVRCYEEKYLLGEEWPVACESSSASTPPTSLLPTPSPAPGSAPNENPSTESSDQKTDTKSKKELSTPEESSSTPSPPSMPPSLTSAQSSTASGNAGSVSFENDETTLLLLVVFIVVAGILMCVIMSILVVIYKLKRSGWRDEVSVLPCQGETSIGKTDQSERPSVRLGSLFASARASKGGKQSTRGAAPAFIRSLPKGKSYHYFLSHKKVHSRLNKQPELLALSVHDCLSEKGFTGFFDVDNLKKINRDELKQNVQDSDAMIVCLHDETFQSDWCRLEWLVAKEEDIPVICVLDQDNFVESDVLAQCTSAGCLNLLEHQWVSYTATHRKQAIAEITAWLEAAFKNKSMSSASTLVHLTNES